MLLHLVLYSTTNEDYIKMYDLTRKYYKNFSKDIVTYYYMYDNTIEIDESELYKPEYLKKIYIKDDIIYLPGKENFIPGILIKTILAFEYISNQYHDYSHIIRSNISSVINLNKFQQYLSKQTINYGGCWLFDLQWTDVNSGIMTTELFGTKFISGTCIILSKYSVNKLISHKKDLRLDIIDDVAIALLLKEYQLTPIQFGCLAMTRENEILTKVYMDMYFEKIFVYRNKQVDKPTHRICDIENMKIIIDYLINKSNHTTLPNNKYLYSLFYK